jgi:hypothetical protein
LSSPAGAAFGAGDRLATIAAAVAALPAVAARRKLRLESFVTR